MKKKLLLLLFVPIILFAQTNKLVDEHRLSTKSDTLNRRIDSLKTAVNTIVGTSNTRIDSILANPIPRLDTRTDSLIAAFIAKVNQDVRTTASPTFVKVVTDTNRTDVLDIIEGTVPENPASNTARIFSIADDGFTVLEVLTPAGIRRRINQDNYRVARNTSDVSIAAAQAVHYTGSTENKPNFALAQADSEATMPAVGLTTATVANNSYGEIMTLGKLTGVKTDYTTPSAQAPVTNWVEGQQLYIDPTTAGGLTNYRPVHPNIAQWIGTIEVVHATQGVILVKVQSLTGVESGTNRTKFAIGDEKNNDTLKFAGPTEGNIAFNGAKFDFGGDTIHTDDVIEGSNLNNITRRDSADYMDEAMILALNAYNYKKSDSSDAVVGFYSRPYMLSWMTYKYDRADSNSATLGFYPRQQQDALLNYKYNKSDSSSTTLGFYPRQQMDAWMSYKYDKADSNSSTLGFYSRLMMDAWMGYKADTTYAYTKAYVNSLITYYVLKTTTLSAGVGISSTGLGDLSGNRTVNVDTPAVIAGKTYVENQYVPRDSLTNLRSRFEALADRVAIVEAWIASQSGAPSYDTTKFYVDYNTGVDGTNEGHNPNTPLKTLAKLMTFTLQAGDSIFLAKGSTWREYLSITNSGSAGSPIAFTSFGTGDKPRINGASLLTTWVQGSATRWACHSNDSIYNVWVNGVQMVKARTPNWNTYFNMSGATSTRKVRSTSLSSYSEDQLVGASVIARTVQWYWSGVKTIESNKDDSVVTSTSMSSTGGTNYPFYLEGQYAMLDTLNEWVQVGDSVYLMISTNPNSSTIEGTRRDYGIILSGVSYVNIDSLQVEKQKSSGIYSNGTLASVNVRYNIVWDQTDRGINFAGVASDCEVSYNKVQRTNGRGISMQYAYLSRILDDTVKSIGLYPGRSIAAHGISTDSINMTIIGNVIDSTASDGAYLGSHNYFAHNYVRNWGMNLTDIGGVYFGGKDNDTIMSNIFEGGELYTSSNGLPAFTTVVGIYADASSNYALVKYNTCIRTGTSGFFNQYGDHHNTVQYNRFYNIYGLYGSAIYYVIDSTQADYSTNNFSYNKISNNLNSTTYYVYHQDRYAKWHAWRPIGTMDNNEYYNPRGWATPFVGSTPAGAWAVTLAQKRDSLAGTEASSTFASYKTFTAGTCTDTILKNIYSNADSTYTLASNSFKYPYTGTFAATSITLGADSSVILVVDNDSTMDSYALASVDTDGELSTNWGTDCRGNSFTGNGNKITSITVRLKKVGAPTGNFTVEFYAHQGTYGTNSRPTAAAALAATDNLDRATLTTDFADYKLYLATPLQTVAGTKYCWSAVSLATNHGNHVVIGYDNSTPSHAGNAFYGLNKTGWSEAASDIPFVIFGTAP